MLATIALAASACAFTPPASQKGEVTPECRTRCQTNHDRCVLDAKSGEAIQTCDAEEKWCVSHCGP
jgi:hypothetical protein